MNKKSLIYLFLGLLFSQIFQLYFSVLGGVSFQRIAFKLWPPAELALVSGGEFYLSSVFSGYILYIIFCFYFIKRKYPIKVIMPAIFLMLMTSFSLFFEISAIVEDYMGYYNGKHMRVGWILFVYGLHVYNRFYRNVVLKRE